MKKHEYDDLPLEEANQRLQEDQDHAVAEVTRLKLERGRRLHVEMERTGKSPTDIGAAIGISAQRVSRLVQQWRESARK